MIDYTPLKKWLSYWLLHIGIVAFWSLIFFCTHKNNSLKLKKKDKLKYKCNKMVFDQKDQMIRIGAPG